MRFVLLIGVLSFFPDFTQGGSRSILGPFLASLQASATLVGIVTGLGELLGSGLRFVSVRLADINRPFLAHHDVQLRPADGFRPALALAGGWPTAAVLIVLERIGKAVRNPPRVVMLSYAGKRLGGYDWACRPGHQRHCRALHQGRAARMALHLQ